MRGRLLGRVRGRGGARGVELVSALCVILKSDLSFLLCACVKLHNLSLFHRQFLLEQRKRLVQAIVPNLVPNVLL